MQNIKNLEKLVCPKCKGDIERKTKELFCAKCELDFPIIENNIIPFFAKPDAAIATAYWSLYQGARRWQNQSANMSKAIKISKRKKTLLPLLKALHDNSGFFKDWMYKLGSFVKPEALVEVADQRNQNNYGYNFNYLTRDWSQPLNPEVELTLENLKKIFKKYKPQGEAAFLGFGTGRFAAEFADQFDALWGVDSSFGQIAQFSSLLERAISLWEVNTKNQVNSKKLAKKVTASVPDKLKSKSKAINYIWADTLNSPFKDNHFDWIVSIYFSDVKPLPKLLAEVKRILKPGGYFLHYGPLHYHFNKIEHHYAYDEFKQFFVDNKFEILYDSTSKPRALTIDKGSLLLSTMFIDKILLLRNDDSG